MRQTKIVLLGCCVSDEPFKRFPQSSFKIVTKRFGTSLISLMSPPLSPDITNFSHLPRWKRRCVEGDFTRSSLDILDFDFDYLLIDFGEESNDLIKIGDSYALNTVYARESGVLNQFPDYEDVVRYHPATKDLWKEACLKFCHEFLANIPQDRIILHRVQRAILDNASTDHPLEKPYITTQLSKVFNFFKRLLPYENFLGQILRKKIIVYFGGVERYVKKNLNAELSAQLNPVLLEYCEYFQELLPRAHVINIPAEYCVSDVNHKLGFSPYHYIQEYDACFMSQMEKIAGTHLSSK